MKSSHTGNHKHPCSSREGSLYQELLNCLEEEAQALVSVREEAILAAAARKEALLKRLLELKQNYENTPEARGHGPQEDRLAQLRRRVAAANDRNRQLAVAALEVVHDFLAQLQPPDPGIYEPAGARAAPASPLFQRQA
ncbi:MAG: flagellar export chaperone FlgN [Deltaproteobacteria bacterium]|nr:flagellar export chaperone FlgN [Deltaproteobacteria bacterium]